MTDNSKLTLRWEIDNPEEKFASGKVKSSVFNEGGFEWTIVAQRDDDDEMRVTLKCGASRHRPWNCEAQVTMYQCLADGSPEPDCGWEKEYFCFNKYNRSLENAFEWDWYSTTNQEYIINGKVVFEVVINIISSKSGEYVADPNKFDAPNSRSDVILLIGDRRLHVSKELLSVHSPVFENLFFGDFAEKGKEEIEIKDVVFEEFNDLLHMIYPGRFMITDSTVIHLLKLADRFQTKDILDSAVEHLQASIKVPTAEKLRLADLYRLDELRDYCLQSYSTAKKIAKLEGTPEFANYSADMKIAIGVRVMKLVQANK